MGYYTRVFCKSKLRPKIYAILDEVESKGFKMVTNLSDSEAKNDNWKQFELIYDKERLPLQVELNEIENPNGLAAEEIDEFLELVGEPRLLEIKKKKVISHLKETKYIVCIQLPTSDIVDIGYDVNGELMRYLEINFSGMIQADNEGFYLGTKRILELKE